MAEEIPALFCNVSSMYVPDSLFVGTSATSPNLYGPNYRVHVSGDAAAGAWYNLSDARLKSDIVPLTNVLDKLSAVRGISHTWNEEALEMGYIEGERDIGVIAQEVEAVFPEIVTRPKDGGYMAVEYGKLTPILIEAVKELKAEKDALEERVEALETALRKQQLGRVTTTSAGGQ